MNDQLIKAFSSLDSAIRKPQFQKSELLEQALEYLNARSDDLPLKIAENSLPPIIIVGGPRTGSTYLTQLLASHLHVGYISNLMASLYARPVIGAILQKHLLANRIHSLREFSSVHGVTKRIEEPHEFGYFWSKYLIADSECHQPENKNSIPSNRYKELADKLGQISTVFNLPCVMKSSLGCFHSAGLVEHTNAMFISIKRDRQSMKDSILRVREERFGNVESWWSLKPQGTSLAMALSIEEQVNWQIEKITQAQDEFVSIAPHRTLEVFFDQLTTSPHTILQNVITFYQQYTGETISYAAE